FRSRLSGRSLDLGSDDGFGFGLACLGSLCLTGSALFNAFLGLLARLRFLRVVARRTLADASRVKEAQHAVGGLRAHAQPMRDTVRIDLHALGRILRQQRV